MPVDIRTSCLVCFLLTTTAVSAQQADPDSVTVERWQIGMTVEATGMCSGILATIPVPMDWPEQRVREVTRELSPQVAWVRERSIDDGVRQLLISIPRLRAGETASAIVTLDVWKRTLSSPEETDGLVAPHTRSRKISRFLGNSPSIETNHPQIQKLAEDIVQGKESDWEKARTIYDWVRENVEYRFDEELKGALTALKAGHGDCEELTSLFVALCRANDIPARSVWIPGHCYPEFYLETAAGDGVWFACQAAGSEQFGELPETRPILQKGDKFRLPGERKEKRYVAETFRAQNATANPRVEFIRKKLPVSD